MSNIIVIFMLVYLLFYPIPSMGTEELGNDKQFQKISNSLAKSLQLEDFKKAERDQRRLLKLLDEKHMPQDDVAKSLVVLATILIREKKYSEAETVCREVISVSPAQKNAALRQLAVILANLGQNTQSEEICLDMRKLHNPKSLAYFDDSLLLGTLYQIQNRLDDAAKTYKGMIEIATNKKDYGEMATSYLQLGRIQIKSSELDNAEQTIVQCITLCNSAEAEDELMNAAKQQCFRELAKIYQKRGGKDCSRILQLFKQNNLKIGKVLRSH